MSTNNIQSFMIDVCNGLSFENGLHDVYHLLSRTFIFLHLLMLQMLCLLILFFCFNYLALPTRTWVYFLVFPAYCQRYEGPHSILCYESIWLDAGCTSPGYHRPKSLTVAELAQYHSLNIRYNASEMFEIVLQ